MAHDKTDVHSHDIPEAAPRFVSPRLRRMSLRAIGAAQRSQLSIGLSSLPQDVWVSRMSESPVPSQR